MRRLRLATILLLLFPMLSAAQTASFVTMIGSNASYAGGTMTANFLPPANSSQFDYLKYHFPFTVSGTLNGGGAWSLSLADTSSVLPANSQWRLTMCSAGTNGAPVCYTVITAVTCISNINCSGTTLDLTSSFSGAPNPGGGGASVSITSPNSTLSLSPSPVTGTGTMDINLGNANSWSAAQTFSVGITIPSTGTNQGITFGTNDSVQHVAAGGLAFGQGGTQGLMLAGTGKDLRILDAGDYAFTSALNVGPDTTITRPAAGAVAIGTFYNSNGTMDFQQWNITPVTITTSATPAIGTASLQTITLSANATPTITIATGERMTIEICQPASGGPYTWTWPAAVHGGMSIGTTASTCSIQSFVSYNGTTLVPDTPGVSNVAP